MVPVWPRQLDLLIYDQNTTLGIAQIRQLQHFLSTTPRESDIKLAAILFAETLTHESQQALLKTLEEPPEYARIVFLINNPNQLLPTILSRCRLINANLKSRENIPAAFTGSFTDFLNHRTDLYTLTDQFTGTGSDPNTFILWMIDYWRSNLKQTPHPLSLYNLTLALYSYKLLATNTNPKLILDYYFSHLRLNSAGTI
jgi:hypothetical protein